MFFTEEKPDLALIPRNSWEILVGLFGCRGIPIIYSLVEKNEGSWLESRSSIVLLEPAVCKECRSHAPIHFKNKKVILHHGDASIFSFNTKKDVFVDSTTTVEMIRLFAYELFGIEPIWQKLTHKSQTLICDTKTLEYYAVHPGDTITVTRAESCGLFQVHDTEDDEINELSDDDDDETKPKRRPAGFQGTAFDGTSLSK